MPRGGYRPGSGRKSNAEIENIRSLMDNTIDKEEWQTVINRLLALAKKGNIRATQLLFTYRFGDPYAKQETELGPFRFITVHQPPCNRKHVDDDDFGKNLPPPAAAEVIDG